jgi:ParB family chromosome partitioning protein
MKRLAIFLDGTWHANNEKGGLASELETVVESMKNVPWTAIADLKKDENLLKNIDEASALLATLRKTLSS